MVNERGYSLGKMFAGMRFLIFNFIGEIPRDESSVVIARSGLLDWKY